MLRTILENEITNKRWYDVENENIKEWDVIVKEFLDDSLAIVERF